MNLSRRLLYVVVPVCVFVPGAVAQPSRLAGRIDAARAVVLTGHVHPRANAQNDRGQVEGSFPLSDVTLLFKPSAAQQADLQQLLQNQQDPSSPGYHRWLTPEQYADRFGVSSSDLAQITAWLESQGFTINYTARSRSFVSFSGTAAQAQTAFHTAIHRYSVNGQAHYANATAPAVPAALADLVAGFRGLTDFHPKPHLRTSAVPHGYTRGHYYISPSDFATMFDIAPLYQAGVDGSGQSMVVVGQTALYRNGADITQFRNNFSLGSGSLQQVLVPHSANPGVQSGDVDEASLDLEWAGAVARNATIIFVYSGDVWNSATYAVDQNLAPVLSISYGACEQEDLVDLTANRSLVLQANAEGMTWFAASGDNGAADCEDFTTNSTPTIAQTGLSVDSPADIPEVTAMGGTELYENGGSYWSTSGAAAVSYIPEIAWNDTSLGGGLAATGGGASTFFGEPAWQYNVAGVPNDGYRHVPDISFPASADHDGYYFISQGSSGFVGGTSAATPTMAGVFVLLNQYLVSTGIQQKAGLANVNPTLYKLAGSAVGSLIFHDTTMGNNIVPCAAGSRDCQNGGVGYTAGPGYDQATGLGSVDVYNLVHNWSTQALLNSGVVPSIDSNPVYESGSKWSFRLTLREEAGVGTTLKDFTINGASHAGEIGVLFGTAAIAPNGSISASYSLSGLAVPTTVVFGFSGMDASGAQWSTQLSVPFQGPLVTMTGYGASNAATGQQVYAPGMLMSVYGVSMGAYAQSAGTIPLPLYLAGFEAYITDSTGNSVTTPLYYVSPTQINLQIPYEIQPGPATLTLGNPYLNVDCPSITCNVSINIASAGPGIFTFGDGSINPSRTAHVGQTVTMFITGEGQVRPSIASGNSPSISTPLAFLPKPRQTVSVTVGGLPASTTCSDSCFVGIPPGLVGVTQINFQIPSGLTAGPQQVIVTVGGVASPPATITITQGGDS